MLMEKVHLWRSKDHLGTYIAKNEYEPIASFIIKAIPKKGVITLLELIEEAQHGFSDTFNLRLLLQVKQHLVVRGIIRIQVQPNRVQVIKLRKSRLAIAMQ